MFRIFAPKTATYTTTDEWTGEVTTHEYTVLTKREARKAQALLNAPSAPINEEW